MSAVRRALFLDRDGVINVDHGYVFRKEDIEFVPGIFDLCRAARQRGYLVFVVTNQAGIGRGYYTESDFQELMRWMGSRFEEEGAAICKVYHCPTHPVHGLGDYKVDSIFRKPGPGMILQAAKEYGVDLATSVLVGDKASDIEAGMAAGVGTNVRFSASEFDVAPNGGSLGVVRGLREVINLLV
jgi:D-glycero-D-manno-heptose 1,7-bisphosphate phosphatase